MNIEVKGDTGYVKLLEKCSVDASKQLFQLGKEESFGKLEKLVVDFRDTEFIDSSTIGVLVTFAKAYRERDAKLVLTDLNDDISSLFSDTGLDLIFNIESSEGIVEEASVNIFEEGVEIRLDIEKETNDDICIFHLAGVMNHPMGSRYFKQQFLLAISEYQNILVDFENLTFFDSLSVSVVISMYKLLERTGGTLKFCRTNYIVEDLFKTLNIDNLIPVYETIDDAIESWKGSGSGVES